MATAIVLADARLPEASPTATPLRITQFELVRLAYFRTSATISKHALDAEEDRIRDLLKAGAVIEYGRHSFGGGDAQGQS